MFIPQKQEIGGTGRLACPGAPQGHAQLQEENETHVKTPSTMVALMHFNPRHTCASESGLSQFYLVGCILIISLPFCGIFRIEAKERHLIWPWIQENLSHTFLFQMLLYAKTRFKPFPFSWGFSLPPSFPFFLCCLQSNLTCTVFFMFASLS